MKFNSAVRHFTHCLLLSGAVLLSGCGDPVENTGEMAQAHLERSEAYEKQGQYKAAIIEARNVVKKDPQNPAGHIRLAHLLKDIGNARSAITVLEPLAQSSKQPDILLLLAQCYRDAGKFHSAEEALQQYRVSGGDKNAGQYIITFARTEADLGRNKQAISALNQLAKDPKHAFVARKNIAALEFRNQNYTAARAEVETLLKQNDEDPELLYIASQLAYLENHLDQAEKYLSNALITLPQSDFIKPLRAKILSQLATVLTQQGRSSEALIYSRLLASENPELHEAKTQLSDALARLDDGDIEGAEALLVELNAEYPTFEPGAVYLGIINFRKGNYDKADKLLSASIDPETAAPKLVSAGALNKLRLNQVGESLALLEQSLKSHPKNEGLLSLYGQIAIRRPAKAEAGAMALEKAIAINPENIKDRLLLANYYVAEGKPERGVAHYEQSLKLAPDNVDVIAAYANFLLQSGQAEQAETTIKGLLAKTPNEPSALILAARFALLQKNPTRAQQLFGQALNADPDNFAAAAGLAELALSAGDLDKALAEYSQLMTKHPSQPEGYKGVITAYELKQKPANGVQLVADQAATGKDKSTPNAVLSEYYLRKGQFVKAEEYFERVVALSPGTIAQTELGATLYYEWAQLNLQQNNTDQARQHLLTASRYAPNNPKLMGTLAEVEILAGRYDQAQQIIADIAAAYPNTAQADLLSGKLDEVRKQPKEALAAYRRGWSKQPSDLAGQLIYRSLQQSGNGADSDRFLEQWLTALPRSEAARIQKATQLQLAGANEEARAIYSNLLEDNPNNLTALNNLAWLYENIDNQRASELAQQAYAVAPENPAVLDTYGWFLHKTGNRAKAVELLESALAKMPASTEIRTHLEAARNGQ